jgi:hypothetical protein
VKRDRECLEPVHFLDLPAAKMLVDCEVLYIAVFLSRAKMAGGFLF